jgi:hypothetical protein
MNCSRTKKVLGFTEYSCDVQTGWAEFALLCGRYDHQLSLG